ncbi:MAG TPA: hypothetical protein VFN54_10655 [Acidimicrobiales bacterium]|nr:hypothetical protein [Acidimicrobiales bacterium]
MSTDSAVPTSRRWIPFALLTLLGVASLATAWLSSRPSSAVVGPEGVVMYPGADLASASSTRSGATTDGVSCQTGAKEVVKYHIHVHVAIFVDGQRRNLPAGIGITQPALVEHYPSGEFYDVGLTDCLYWLHTHVADGIIHVEAPRQGAFTLGQFFDIWNQPLSAHQVGPAHGSVVVFENGRRLSGDPRATPLLSHGDIQIDVGSPVVSFQPFSYRVSGGCGEGTTSCSAPTG